MPHLWSAILAPSQEQLTLQGGVQRIDAKSYFIFHPLKSNLKGREFKGGHKSGDYGGHQVMR